MAVASTTLEPLGSFTQLEVKSQHRDGQWRWQSVTVTNLLEHPPVRGCVVNLRDITDVKVAQERIAAMAYSDGLTGLPNRVAFEERLEELAGQCAVAERQFGVLFIDLDSFKAVNDAYGHAVGDALLQAVGCRLRSHVRPNDLLARLGGDEFVVLIEDVPDIARVQQTAERLLAALREDFGVAQLHLTISASIGMTVAHGRDPSQVLRDADGAMYAAKKAGGAQICLAPREACTPEAGFPGCETGTGPSPALIVAAPDRG